MQFERDPETSDTVNDVQFKVNSDRGPHPQNGSDRLELVSLDIVPRGSSRRSLLFFAPHFSARLDFPSSPLSAPGSLRM